jgi:hypothetical protein
MLVENSRHHSVKSSAETLKKSLERQGLSVSDVQTSCFGTKVYTTFGDRKGKRYCRMKMSVNQNVSVKEANQVIGIVNNSMKDINEYEVDNETLPLLFDAPYHGAEYSIGIIQKNKGTKCGLRYIYDSSKDNVPSEKHLLRIELGCDDTSWFSRTFL